MFRWKSSINEVLENSNNKAVLMWKKDIAKGEGGGGGVALVDNLQAWLAFNSNATNVRDPGIASLLRHASDQSIGTQMTALTYTCCHRVSVWTGLSGDLPLYFSMVVHKIVWADLSQRYILHVPGTQSILETHVCIAAGNIASSISHVCFQRSWYLGTVVKLSLNSCTTPLHTNCSPRQQDPCNITYFEIFWRKWELLFQTMSDNEDRYLRIKNQLTTAQL